MEKPMTVTDRIEINPKVMMGKPVIRGTRIPVELILRKLSEGATEHDLLDAYPRLRREDIQAAIGYAADTVAHEETVVLPPSKPRAKTKRWFVRFLADESCDFAVVRALRQEGHDVIAIAEISRRAEDMDVIRMSLEQDRILLTEDKDFGQLVFAHRAESAGVLLIRYPTASRKDLHIAVRDFVKSRGDSLKNRFAVMRPGRIRIVQKPKLKSSSSTKDRPKK
jgi:uncharacterized protein (DUF433 family)/predicted nuclease of predicted toxin-antitoxin system